MKKWQLMFGYGALLIFGVIFTQCRSVMIMAVIFLNIAALLTNKKLSGLALLSSFILPGEFFPIINVVLVILLNINKLKFRKPPQKYIVYFIFVFAFSMINAIRYGTYINVIVYTVYLVFLFVVLCFSSDKITIEDLIYCLKGFIGVEFLADIVIAIRCNTIIPGDIFVGTMSNAHWIGNWGLVCMMTMLLVQYKALGKKWKDIVYKDLFFIIGGVTVIWLADCKLLVIAMIMGIMLYYLFDGIFKFKNSFFVGFLFLSLTILILSYAIYTPFIKDIVTSAFPKYSAYIYKSEYDFNGKFVYITSTFTKQLKGVHFFMGYGLGQYGSRVANLFAYTEMRRNDNFINNLIANNFNPSFLPDYVQYIRYYTVDFVKNIGNRSAILSYPFNSFTALYAELGVFGAVVFAKLAETYLRNSKCKFLAFYFMIACVFDIFFDNFVCIGVILFIIVNTQYREKLENES